MSWGTWEELVGKDETSWGETAQHMCDVSWETSDKSSHTSASTYNNHLTSRESDMIGLICSSCLVFLYFVII